MEEIKLENKGDKAPKATKKAKEFVSQETIKLIEDILNDGTVDIKWRAQLKEQVRKYKTNGE